MLGKTSDRGPKLAALNSHPLQKTSNHFRAQNEARKNKVGPPCRASKRACAIPLMPAALSFATVQPFLVFSLSLPLTLCVASLTLTQPGGSAEIGTKETRAVQGRWSGVYCNPSILILTHESYLMWSDYGDFPCWLWLVTFPVFYAVRRSATRVCPFFYMCLCMLLTTRIRLLWCFACEARSSFIRN